MAFDHTYLKQSLDRLRSGSISESELTRLVQLSRSIVQAYLQHIRTSASQLCLNQGLTITDLACDCVGEAFARYEDNRFPQLANFISSLSEDLSTIADQNLFLAFKSFMVRIADAQLARLYAQSDPMGSKIYRNIRDALKASSMFVTRKDFRGIVISPCGCDGSDDLPPYPADELEQEFVNRIDHNQSSTSELKNLHDILVGQSRYRRSIPLIELVQIVKKVYRNEFQLTLHEAESISVDGLQDYEIEQLCNKVELALKEKILLTYLARGKVSRKEAEAIFAAFEDMIWDWSHQEEAQSLFKYLSNYSDIDEETYEATLRPKMEYLLKIVREEFAVQLMKDF